VLFAGWTELHGLDAQAQLLVKSRRLPVSLLPKHEKTLHSAANLLKASPRGRRVMAKLLVIYSAFIWTDCKRWLKNISVILPWQRAPVYSPLPANRCYWFKVM